MIEEAARGSQFATTIQPFQNRKNGRAAWLSLLSSHVSADKWEFIIKTIKTSSEWFMTAKRNGKKISLEGFCSSYRSKYTQLVEAAQHVSHQVPNGHTRVGYLIDNIEHSDADLRAAIAQVRTNSQGARDDFEKAVAILLPVDPFWKIKLIRILLALKFLGFMRINLGEARRLMSTYVGIRRTSLLLCPMQRRRKLEHGNKLLREKLP